MDWVLYDGVRTVDIHLSFVSYSVSSLVYGYANINSSPPHPHILYPCFFVLTLKTTTAALCLSEYNGCFLCLECWPLSCFGQNLLHYGLQHCAKLHGINTCQYKYTDVCE